MAAVANNPVQNNDQWLAELSAQANVTIAQGVSTSAEAVKAVTAVVIEGVAEEFKNKTGQNPLINPLITRTADKSKECSNHSTDTSARVATSSLIVTKDYSVSASGSVLNLFG